jgi:hypothetical protein
MKTTANFFTWKNFKWVIGFIAVTFFSWFLDKVFDKLFSKIEIMTHNILTFIGSIELSSFQKVTGILCLLSISCMWLIWYFKEYKQSKKEYFDYIERSINSADINLRYLKALSQSRGESLDLLTMAEKFSEEEMHTIGLSSDQIEKSKQYFKQKYGYEPHSNIK